MAEEKILGADRLFCRSLACAGILVLFFFPSRVASPLNGPAGEFWAAWLILSLIHWRGGKLPLAVVAHLDN